MFSILGSRQLLEGERARGTTIKSLKFPVLCGIIEFVRDEVL
jgi:hypothetical protein